MLPSLEVVCMAKDVDRVGGGDAPLAAVALDLPDAQAFLWEEFFPAAEAHTFFAALLTTIDWRGL